MTKSKNDQAKAFACPACGAPAGASCTASYFIGFRLIKADAPTRSHTARLKLIDQGNRLYDPLTDEEPVS